MAVATSWNDPWPPTRSARTNHVPCSGFAIRQNAYWPVPVPLQSNAVVHLATAVGKIGAWRPDIKLNETTATYFRKLSTLTSGEQAKAYQDVLSPDPTAGWRCMPRSTRRSHACR